MTKNYKVSETTAAMADAVQLLYKFYEKFYTLACDANIGDKGIRQLEDNYQALADTAEMLIGWNVGSNLMNETNLQQSHPEL